MTSANFDGNILLDSFIFLGSVVLGAILLWEAAAMMAAHLSGGSIWKVTLTELVMRFPMFGAVIVVLLLLTTGWLAGHWTDALRMRP